MQARLERRIFELTRPISAAHGVVRQRESLIFELSHGDVSGFGEAAPLESYDGVSLGACADALAAIKDDLAAHDPSDPDQLVEVFGSGMPPQARAALDTAARDLAARLKGVPLAAFLGAVDLNPVDASALIASVDPTDAADEAARLTAAGFRTLKVKVGMGHDRKLLAAIRDTVGDDVRLRIDANGAWEPQRALDELLGLARFSPELCEQPCRGIEGLRWLAKRSPVPIALDEDAHVTGAIDAGVADLVCLKLQTSGGLDQLLAAATHARDAGMGVYLGSALEGPVSIVASMHAALAIRPDLASGLTTLPSLVGMEEVAPARGGRVGPPLRAGIGIGPDGSPC